MPAESIHERIAEALRLRLASIVEGPEYWHTPAAVVRTTFFEDDQLDSSLSHVILVRPGDERHREVGTGDAASGGEIAAEMEVFLLVAKQHRPPTESPYEETAPTRWTVIDRCVRDVLRSLFLEPTLGGLAINVERDGLEVDRARYVAGWALAEIRTWVTYRYLAANP